MLSTGLVRHESLIQAAVLISIHTAELSAAAVLINFWEPSAKVNNAVWITICLLVALGINLMGAGQLHSRLRGQRHTKTSYRCIRGSGVYICVSFLEYRRSSLSLLILVERSIKVITIVGLIILGIVLDLGGGPNHDRIGKSC